MENTLDIFITNLDKRQIKNEKNGEVTDWCMVTYLIPKEDTNRSKGCAQLSCYCSSTAFTSLEKLMMKWTKAKVRNIVDGNRIKLKIISVENVVVS